MNKVPTRAEVKEHFKNAKAVYDGFSQIKQYDENRIVCAGDVWILKPVDSPNIALWEPSRGYAGIAEYKKPEILLDVPKDAEFVVRDNTYESDPEHRFNKVVEDTLESIRELLIVKGKEYRRNDDPFHNFNRGAAMTGKTREEVLQGFLLKHLISVQDMRNDVKLGHYPTEEKVDEKYNDILVYFLIEKASILDKIHNSKK